MAGFAIGWLQFDLPAAFGVETSSTVLYQQAIDPYSAQMPPQFQLTAFASALVFGPLHLLLLWGIWRNASWTWKIALPTAGWQIAATLIYVTSSLTSATPPLNLPAFLGLNGGYVLVAALFIFRFTRSPGGPPG